MKRFTLILILGCFACGTGCQSLGTYFKDRGNDFVDMFTGKVGYGYGVHAGFSCAGTLNASAGVGMFNRAGFEGRHFVKDVHEVAGVPIGNIWFPATQLKKDGQETCAVCTLLAFSPLFTGFDSITYLDNQIEELSTFTFEDHADVLHMGFLGLNPVGIFRAITGDDPIYDNSTLDASSPHFYRYYDIRVHGSCFLCFEFGINPIEIADFILGWFGVDFAEDDTKPEAVKKKSAIKKPDD